MVHPFLDGPPTFQVVSVGQQDFDRIGQYEGSNPVIARGSSEQSDFKIREIGNVLYEPADTGKEYKIFYTGYRLGVTTDEKIHYAYSSDGKSWTKYASNPVLSVRSEDPYVIKVGATYYLYVEDKEAAGAGEANMLHRFSSSDCMTWADDGQITGITDVQSPVVWKEGATWYLLYEHYPTAPLDIRLATSADGLAWTDEASNPVMSPEDCAWSVSAVTAVVPDDIIKIDATYYMLYHGQFGTTFQQGIAHSTDLLTWTDGTHNPLWTDQAAAFKPNTMMLIGGVNNVLYYYMDDTSGIYRGYPLAPV